MKLRSVRGTHDLYGNDIKKYKKIEDSVLKNANLNSFNELKTPIFEFTELFSKPLGEQSDVVLKEMYTFKDRNDENLTLRPEYTTPMIRAAITNNLLIDLPLKVYGLGPMFRRERPQKGRYRQFNQINFEIFGSNDFMADIELIVIANNILKNLLPNADLSLNINSLGQKDVLIKYKKKLSKYFSENQTKLSPESLNKIDSNPLRILDSKEANDVKISESAPLIQEFLSVDDKNHFAEIKKGLKSFNIDFIENPKLVRGLDYYCNTVFEFKTKSLGSQDTLLGGGRYDGLIEALGGPKIAGVGWAAGIERISMLMDYIEDKKYDIHLAISKSKYSNKLQEIMRYLMENNISFYWNYKYNLKKSLTKANQKNAKFIIIIGDDEYKNDFYTVKNLITGNQSKQKITNIKKILND